MARDLDRQIRAQFVEESLRPEYLKDYQRHLHNMIRHVDSDVVIGGRLPWLKRIIVRLIRPIWHHQVGFNRMMIDRMSELHEDLTRLTTASEELHVTLMEDMERQAEAIRANLMEGLGRLAMAGAPARQDGLSGDATRRIEAGSRLVLGTVAVKRPGYVHVDPTADGPADLSAPLDHLPMAPGTAAEVVVANALERYSAAEVRGRLLPYWASLLQAGGRLTIVADDPRGGGPVPRRPDRFPRADRGALRRRRPRPSFRVQPDLLRQYVLEAGLTDVSVMDRRQKPDAGAYGFELAAFRPAA
ncbi:MAG: hypothetical protein WKF75_12510 [Singulisphaera sp.]